MGGEPALQGLSRVRCSTSGLSSLTPPPGAVERPQGNPGVSISSFRSWDGAEYRMLVSEGTSPTRAGSLGLQQGLPVLPAAPFPPLYICFLPKPQVPCL